MDVHKMLEQVKAGQLDIAEAEEKLKDLPYDQEECFSISDKVAVMNGGVIEQAE